MSYKKGDIVVVKFPFLLREGSEKQKGRPALVISNDKVKKRYNDVILAAITSHIPTTIMEAEIILESRDLTGLLKRSLLRLDFIMTVPSDLISGKIGKISNNIIAVVHDKLKLQFGLNH